MNHLEYLKNYLNDLLCSKTTPLLIELNQDEIRLLNNDSQKENVQYSPLKIAELVYNKNQDKKGCNIIVIDTDNEASKDSFILLETLLEALRDELKSIKNITTLKETLKTAVSMGTGGLLNDFAGDYLDKHFDFIFDEVSDQFSDLLTEVAVDNIDISKTLLSSIEGLLGDTTGDQLGNLADNINKQALNLSSSAKSELDKLSSTFSKSKNNDVFQLTFKLLLAIAIDSPKLIYINNPHKLDNNSIGMLSLLFSFAKNQKALDKHIGLSVVYTYTDEQFHLYNDVDKSLQSKQQLLMGQRRFVQRYAMLEKPGSDIPIVAVKSSLFIGRNEELETLSRQFINRQPTTLSVISGEPGIGKTALVNQHLSNIQKQEDVIQLTLFNEVGHSSTNTGLSSLEKSILDEAKRLELLIGWKDKGLNFIKNSGTKENAFKAIGLLFSGADKALGIADAGYQRIKIDSHVDGLKQIGMGDLESKQGDEKQRQFNGLDKAIKKLQSITSQPLPLVLFIDDLQWIDDTASEYIITRLLQQPDLYIVTTLRPSDAATILKEQLTRPSLHEYTLGLLKACEVKGFESCSESVDVDSLEVEIININGFDKLALRDLVSKVIQADIGHCESLANSIFTVLAEGGARDVNTLFAVETINMLCDKKLYSENNKLERLILDSPLRFNPDIKDIDNALSQTFTMLESKYQSSLAHANKSSNNQSFNLMAYAVLEERLYLLKLYFGEQGNMAINTLLLSSLLGTPFSSELVKKVIVAILNTDIPVLQLLKSYIGSSKTQMQLQPEHYAIIDEVYEILRRLSYDEDKYQYRHGLLHTFLDKQFDYLLESIVVNNTLEAKNELILLIIKTVNSDPQNYDISSKVGTSLTAKEMNIQLFYQGVITNVLAKGFSFDPDFWATDYQLNLTRLADYSGINNQISDAIALQKKALHITGNYYYYQIKSGEWAEKLVKILLKMTALYNQDSQISTALKFQEEALAICEDKYNKSPKLWVIYYMYALLNIKVLYKKTNKDSQVKSIDEKIMTISKYFDNKAPDECTEDELVIKRYIARSPTELEELLIFFKGKYQKESDIWVVDYVGILNELATLYNKTDHVKKAIECQTKALLIQEKQYHKSKDLWAKDYAVSLSNIAHYHGKNKQVHCAIELQEKGITICENYYNKTPNLWAKTYEKSLNNIAELYVQDNQINEAIECEEKARFICKRYYDQESAPWVENYRNALEMLVRLYHKKNQLNECRSIHKIINELSK